MNIRKWMPALASLILLFAALACNLPLTGGGDPPTAIGATLTPLPTSEFVRDDPLPDPLYFAEEFENGLPENWTATSGWRTLSGVLIAGTGDQVLEIPGPWQDFSLFNRLKFNSGEVSFHFNHSEAGFYSLRLTRETLSLDWQPEGGELEMLTLVQTGIDTDWHDLVLRQTHGKAEVLLDGELLLKQVDLGLSAAGSISLNKTESGKLEIDRLVMAPPGMGPGSPAPTPGPVLSSLDLSLVEVSVEEDGELVAWLINNGPDSTQGHALNLTLIIAGEEPALAIVGGPLPVLMDREWVNLFPIETGIIVDAQYSGQPLLVEIQALDYNDPDNSNDQLEQFIPDIP